MKDFLPQRKNIRLKEYDYSSAGYYFITICIKQRLPVLSSIDNMNVVLTDAGMVVDKYINCISEIYTNVELDTYVIMPNHIHMILNIDQSNISNLSTIIQQFKRAVSKQLGYSIWQKLFHEHIIRNEKEYYKIYEYILNNPLSWEQDKYFEM